MQYDRCLVKERQMFLDVNSFGLIWLPSVNPNESSYIKICTQFLIAQACVYFNLDCVSMTFKYRVNVNLQNHFRHFAGEGLSNCEILGISVGRLMIICCCDLYSFYTAWISSI